MRNKIPVHVQQTTRVTRDHPLHWLIVSDSNSSLVDMALGRPLAQGTPVPAKFVEFLCNLGDQVTLVLPIRTFSEKRATYLPSNLKIVPISVRKGLSRAVSTGHIYRALAPIIAEKRPDIIYASGYDAIYCAFLARWWKIPCFTRMYGTFLTQLLHQPWRRLRNIPKLFAEALVLKLAKTGVIVTNDGTQGDRVCAKLRVPSERFFFEPNGIDREELRTGVTNTTFQDVRQRYRVPSNAFLISSVSRLASWKRIDLVLEAINRLEGIQASLKQEVYLVIAGDGSSHVRNSLRNLASRSWMSDRIQFLGSLPRRDVLQLLTVSDITTSFYEVTNVGNVLLESLQLGTVVAARGNGDTNRFISDKINGFLLPEGPEDLVAQFGRLVCQLQTDQTLGKKIRQAAVHWADANLLEWADRFQLEYDWILHRAGLNGFRTGPSLTAA